MKNYNSIDAINIEKFYCGKKVFVTGHTGFKGSWLCQWLLQMGAEVRGYALAAEEESLFRLANLDQWMMSDIADIRDYHCLQKTMNAFQPEIVFHLAAQPLVRRSYQVPLETFEVNVMGTACLLESIRQVDTIRSAVMITTDKVYQNREWCWGYREEDVLGGYDPYSSSKACCELVTDSYQKSFFCQGSSAAVSTVRAGNVIGGGDFSEDRIIPDCLRAAAARKIIEVRYPHSIRPYQHVLDCLYGYLLLAQQQYEEKKISGSYNFGPDEKDCVTTQELVEQFCQIWGQGQQWIDIEKEGPHEAGFLKLDCSKARSILKWKPQWDIKQALKETIRWHRGYLQNENCRLEMERQINAFRNV